MKNKIEVTIHDAVFTNHSRCVSCNRILDAATGLQSRVPKEGDWTVCAYCGAIMVFQADKKLRAATDEEMEEFKASASSEYALAEILSRMFAAKRAEREN